MRNLALFSANLSNRAQFNQHYMYSFYARRSQIWLKISLIADLRKVAVVKFCNVGLVLGFRLFLILPHLPQKNYPCFKSGRKELKNNHPLCWSKSQCVEIHRITRAQCKVENKALHSELLTELLSQFWSRNEFFAISKFRVEHHIFEIFGKFRISKFPEFLNFPNFFQTF